MVQSVTYQSETKTVHFQGEKHCAGKSYAGTLSEGKGKAEKGD